MTSSTSTSSTSTSNNPPNPSAAETAIYEYMRHFADYQENGIDFIELSQIRQLDLYLQNCYNRVQELVDSLRDQQQSESAAEIQTKLINTLIQAKAIGDKKMQLSQQMLDATERQSRKLKLAHQKYIESVTQQSNSTDPNSHDIDSDNEYDADMTNARSLSAKTSTTSLWKRKTTTTANTSTSTLNLKRKCVTNVDHNNDQRDRKKTTQRSTNSNNQTSNNANGKRIKLNNESSSTPSDEPTYCLCSQLSYGSMILCDSKACEIKWFHFNCVNLTTKPKGKWFCPNCRDNRT